MALFQIHHIISQALAKTDRLLQALQEATGGSQFDVNAQENLIELPAARELAKETGQSPHNGRPLDSYENPIAEFLQNLVARNKDQFDFLTGADPLAAKAAADFFNSQIAPVQAAIERARPRAPMRAWNSES